MKIFPPLSEMLWPPGYGVLDMARRYRHLLFAATGFVAVVIAWPYAHVTPQQALITALGDTSATTRAPAKSTVVEINRENCSTLLRKDVGPETVQQACAEHSSRLQAGSSIAKDIALARGDQPSSGGPLTAADRAIPAPPSLRSSVWDEGKLPPVVPPLALSPTAN